MVSIFSFFTKKRPKASDTPTETRRPVTPPSPRAKTSSTAATVGTRSKNVRKSVVVHGTTRRSADGGRRGKVGGSGTVSPSHTPPRITIDLPFEARGAGLGGSGGEADTTTTTSLGLDGVGRTPSFTPSERRALDSQRYTPADLRAAWDWLGPEVKERGAETVGIMLPRRLLTSKDRQRQIGALFVLARRPQLADKFPSITSNYPAVSGDAATDEWKSRLMLVAKDTVNPVDIAEVLKAMLRRLAATDRPIIDPAAYVRFVQQEHAASYPRSSYASMLLPQLSDETMGLLDAVFEVCNAIAMHAETNAMGAGRLCHLFGWWLMGEVPDGTTSWSALYDGYKLAGQRTEHLFYARIRWQSTQQKMPRRLIQLILSYPFGESSASAEHLPLPPTSTFSRKALHVSLGTDTSLPIGTDPVKVLGDALIAKLDDEVEASSWLAVRDTHVTLDDVLSDDSRAFLEEVSLAKGLEFASPPTSPTSPIDEDKYHPFAAGDSDRIVNSKFSPSHSRRRSQSYGDIPRLDVPGGAKAPSLDTVPAGDGSPRRSQLVRQTSAVQLSPTKDKATPQWDDFLTSGFGDSPDTVRDISLSLNSPRTTLRDTHHSSPTPGSPLRLGPPKKIVVKGPTSTSLLVAGEQIVDIDDAFIHFVEDGQLDPVASSSWPRFALVQLSKPVPGTDGDEAIDWVLVTVKKREIKRLPSIDEPFPDLRADLTRSLSPSNESTVSRLSQSFGFRDLANTFRRSSMYSRSTSTSRMSFLNNSYNGKGAVKSESLSAVAERAGHRGSGASDAPTEYTIGEMGEIVKIPSSFELAGGAAAATAVGASVTSPSSSGPTTSNAVITTPATDWVYLGEGGAHVIFRYRGVEPSLQGRAVRLQKIAKAGGPDIALRQTWADSLLPKLVPNTLLTETTPATVEEKWIRALVTPTELLRPSSRRAEGSLNQIVDYTRPAQLMDNHMAAVPGEKVLALEIKPKWGFLPTAADVTPNESVLIKTSNCRYCIHQHYRGASLEGAYCPLDLYSGEADRVQKALGGLWAAWRSSGGEKNNLRVFVDGKRILPFDAKEIPSNTPEPEGTYDFVAPLLASSGVLSTLKTLQSTLDHRDISSLSRDFAAANPAAKLFAPDLVPEPSAAELTEFVTVYKAGDGASKWTLRQQEIAYALSAIFKDCSIIVRAVLAKDTEGKYTVDEAKSSVKLIDTDLKPLASLGHWAELDDKLWRHWSATNGEGVVVIDSDDMRPVAAVSRAAAPGTPGKTAATTAAAAAVTTLAAAAAATMAILTEERANTERANTIPEVEDATSALAKVAENAPEKSQIHLPLEVASADVPAEPDHTPMVEEVPVVEAAVVETTIEQTPEEPKVVSAPIEAAPTAETPAVELEPTPSTPLDAQAKELAPETIVETKEPPIEIPTAEPVVETKEAPVESPSVPEPEPVVGEAAAIAGAGVLAAAGAVALTRTVTPSAEAELTRAAPVSPPPVRPSFDGANVRPSFDFERRNSNNNPNSSSVQSRVRAVIASIENKDTDRRPLSPTNGLAEKRSSGIAIPKRRESGGGNGVAGGFGGFLRKASLSFKDKEVKEVKQEEAVAPLAPSKPISKLFGKKDAVVAAGAGVVAAATTAAVVISSDKKEPEPEAEAAPVEVSKAIETPAVVDIPAENKSDDSKAIETPAVVDIPAEDKPVEVVDTPAVADIPAEVPKAQDVEPSVEPSVEPVQEADAVAIVDSAVETTPEVQEDVAEPIQVEAPAAVSVPAETSPEVQEEVIEPVHDETPATVDIPATREVDSNDDVPAAVTEEVAASEGPSPVAEIAPIALGALAVGGIAAAASVAAHEDTTPAPEHVDITADEPTSEIETEQLVHDPVPEAVLSQPSPVAETIEVSEEPIEESAPIEQIAEEAQPAEQLTEVPAEHAVEVPASPVPVQESIEEPTVEEPVVQELAVEEPAVQELAVEEPAFHELAIQEPAAKEIAAEEIPVEQPTLEEAPIEEAPIEETAVEESPISETIDEPVVSSEPVPSPVLSPVPSPSKLSLRRRSAAEEVEEPKKVEATPVYAAGAAALIASAGLAAQAAARAKDRRSSAQFSRRVSQQIEQPVETVEQPVEAVEQPPQEQVVEQASAPVEPENEVQATEPAPEAAAAPPSLAGLGLGITAGDDVAPVVDLTEDIPQPPVTTQQDLSSNVEPASGTPASIDAPRTPATLDLASGSERSFYEPIPVPPTPSVQPPSPVTVFGSPTASERDGMPAPVQGFSAVTPEFTAPSRFSVVDSSSLEKVDEETPLDSSSTGLTAAAALAGVAVAGVAGVAALANEANDSDASSLPSRSDSRLKRSTAPSPSPHLSGPAAGDDLEVEVVVRDPSISAVSPMPRDAPLPEHVELYQNAVLPPLPSTTSEQDLVASSEALLSPPDVEAPASDISEVASQASSPEVDPTTFATAPDTPFELSEHGHGDQTPYEDETPTLELGSLQQRLADSPPRPGPMDLRSDHRNSVQSVVENYRSSVHTFGGTPAEAAWLNSGLKSEKTSSSLATDPSSFDDLRIETAALPTSMSGLSSVALQSMTSLPPLNEDPDQTLPAIESSTILERDDDSSNDLKE